MKFLGKVGNGPVIKFWWWSGSQIWIRIATGKTCLGRGRHCPSASSLQVPWPSCHPTNSGSVEEDSEHWPLPGRVVSFLPSAV